MRREYFLLIFISICLSIIFIFLQESPGYMDAEYHSVMGYQIATGKGFNEPFIWNYSDYPESIVHASHTYWMPLPSLISALGFWIINQRSFFAARLFFVLLSAFVPIVTYWVALRITAHKGGSFTAGLLSIFCGYYAAYSTIPDAFGLYMVCGGIIFLLLDRLNSYTNTYPKTILTFLSIGIMTGIMHLSRTEGLIWFIACCLFCFFNMLRKKHKYFVIILNISAIFMGYMLIMGTWYSRNLQVFSTLFPPGNQSAFFITDYDQLFSFDTSKINFFNWSNRATLDILRPMIQSIMVVIGTVIGVQSMVFLLPFVILGSLKYKKNVTLGFFLLMFVSVIILMGCVFPFAGKRGGYFHTSAAFQPVVLALSVAGAMEAAEALKRHSRKSKVNLASLFNFSIGALAILVTAFVSINKIFGGITSPHPVWEKNRQAFQQVDRVLSKLGIPNETVVVISNPPGWFWETGRSSIVTPFEGEQAVVMAANRYGAEYVVLEPDHVASLDQMYNNPSSAQFFEHIGSFENGIEIFRITDQE